MVDRGFNIGDQILQRGAKLCMPPFTRKGKKLNRSEIIKTRNTPSPSDRGKRCDTQTDSDSSRVTCAECKNTVGLLLASIDKNML